MCGEENISIYTKYIYKCVCEHELMKKKYMKREDIIPESRVVALPFGPATISPSGSSSSTSPTSSLSLAFFMDSRTL